MRSRSIIVVMLAALAAFALPERASGERPPNVLVIVADDLRPDAIAALGGADVITPNLDRLVRDGTSFDRAYCFGSSSGAVCAPSRAMMLTGRHEFDLPPRFAVPWHAGETGTPVTLPEALRGAGYETFATGKWHQDRASFRRAFSAGAAIFFGGMGSHTTLPVHAFDPTGAYPRAAAAPLDEFSSAAFASAFLRFLEGRGADAAPFFAWVSFTAPHDPRTPPRDFRALYRAADLAVPPNFLPEHPFDNGELMIRDEKLAPFPRTTDEIRRHLAEYYGMVTHLDAQVGRMRAGLEAAGVAGRTIVVFLSDHGLAIGSHGLLGKQNLYEHSMRSPFVVAGPGIPAGRRVETLAYLHDLAPTVCDLVGVAPPADGSGRSLAPHLGTGPPSPDHDPRDALLLFYRHVQRAVVETRWKLIDYPEAGVTQLFDLDADPHETRDLAAERPEEVERLRTRLATLMAAYGDPEHDGEAPAP